MITHRAQTKEYRSGYDEIDWGKKRKGGWVNTNLSFKGFNVMKLNWSKWRILGNFKTIEEATKYLSTIKDHGSYRIAGFKEDLKELQTITSVVQ